MTKALPFKVQPKKVEEVDIGNESTGIISIQKYGRLLPVEQKFIDTYGRDKELREKAIEMARNIAQASGKKLAEVYQWLIDGNLEQLQEYLHEAIEFQSAAQEITAERNVCVATAILKHRINPDWTIEDTTNPELMPPALIDLIVEFAEKELSGWKEPEAEAEAAQE